MGLELEFLVFYNTHDQPTVVKDNERYGPIIKAPRDIAPPLDFDPKENRAVELEAAWVREKVAEVIMSAGFKAVASCSAKGTKYNTSLLNVWNVVPDGSVKLPLDFEQAYSPLKSTGVEINSPVFTAGKDAFKEISTVIQTINAAFRTAVPPVCGLHVHVGRDRMPLKLRPVQRTAGMLWMAEDLINVLHAGCRLGNEHCLSMRDYSHLRCGMGAKAATRHPARLGKPQHVAFTTERVKRLVKKPTTYTYTRPTGITASNESTLSRLVAAFYNIGRTLNPEKGLPETLDLQHGLQSILRVTDTRAVAELVSFQGWRGAYNFSNMDYIGEQQWAKWGTPGAGSVKSRKPTIEFRQGAGSLDADWVVVWAKICLALCGPAVVESSDDEYFQLLHNCAESGKNPDVYSVFDLLHDIGLSKDDIDVVHHRLQSGRHEREPALAFHRPDGDSGGLLDRGYEVGWHLHYWRDYGYSQYMDDGWGAAEAWAAAEQQQMEAPVAA
ncbi:hypothetical protein SAMD00023353_9300030 [Rosellinia necatrix]|uniref:Amidoligase enzyme n=1 Tax=Rosellinia necatrix TaxID=77044 RepID=A0A1W2TVL7_ROSNE|nr:hypothetical protein SAMD00023353_9300030 [Rosellinia necatrix]